MSDSLRGLRGRCTHKKERLLHLRLQWFGYWHQKQSVEQKVFNSKSSPWGPTSNSKFWRENSNSITCLWATACICWCTLASSSLPVKCKVGNFIKKTLVESQQMQFYSPSPLLWSISSNFLMLSSRAWRVCFCVSIRVSNSCKQKKSVKVQAKEINSKLVNVYEFTFFWDASWDRLSWALMCSICFVFYSDHNS